MTSNQENGKITSHLETTETPEESTKRLSRRLSEYEAASFENAGKANQLRKERDAERALSQKLRKEIDKLSNKFLRERTRTALLEKKVKELDSNEGVEEEQDTGSMEIPSQPCSDFSEEQLTLKVKELKKILEKRIREGELTTISGSNVAEEIHPNMAALAMLHQSLQAYLGAKSEPQDVQSGSADTLETVGTLVEGLKETHVYLRERKKSGKPQVSIWLRILVYLGPIFLSALCYLAFVSVKK